NYYHHGGHRRRRDQREHLDRTGGEEGVIKINCDGELQEKEVIARKFSKQLGDIAGICLDHTANDGKEGKGEAFWHVEEVVVIEKELNNRILFICNALIPLSLKRDETRRLATIKYDIITANEKGVGTDANVFISIYGSNCCGRSSATCLSVARRTASCWSCWTQSQLDCVAVTNTANDITIFMCGKWLDTKKVDWQIFRVLYPKY
uniref:PLAT domain-containing protein n=1 Tax=Hucho hucho TaxID=62062 RepID=A0A4W5K081_9TELE